MGCAQLALFGRFEGDAIDRQERADVQARYGGLLLGWDVQIDCEAAAIFAKNGIGHDDVATFNGRMEAAREAGGDNPLRPMAENEGGGGGGGVKLTCAGMRGRTMLRPFKPPCQAVKWLPRTEILPARRSSKGAGFQAQGKDQAYLAERQIGIGKISISRAGWHSATASD